MEQVLWWLRCCTIVIRPRLHVQLRCVPAQGFHRVEYLLFRERNLTAAEWWAAALVNSSIALSADLLGRCGL